MAGQHDVSLDDLRSKVEQGSLGDDIGSIADILSRVKPEDQVEAFRLYLGWVREIWRSQAAWNLLGCMPPALLPGHDGNAAYFSDLLFPKVARRKPRVPKGPRDFWDWQQEYAKDVPGHLYPNRDAAREKWVMKCRRDPHLRRCVEDLASLYMKFVHFAASDPYPTRYELTPQVRRNFARLGDPVCGHVETFRKCDGCTDRSFEVSEVHQGWRLPDGWRPAKDFHGNVLKHEPEACACCQRNHDFTPVGTVRCALCAEAIYWVKSEMISRRWGGWHWLGESIRQGAELRAREAFQGLVELEDKARLGHFEPDFQESLERARKLGGNPWGDSPLAHEAHETFFIPVSMFRTDLKSDVQHRLRDTFNALWDNLKLKSPKSTGKTPARSRDWDHYIEWLWRHRVMGKSIEEIADAYPSPIDGDWPINKRAVNDGVKLAISTLGDI